ncbi:MAG: HYC_CC_PP family protein [Flavobacterium sp.]
MNVKKVTSLILVLLFLIPNIGMTINVHYCGGSIASVSLHSELLSPTEPEDCCAKADVLEGDGCCKDRLVHLEKKSDDATVKVVLPGLNIPFIVQEQFDSFFVFSRESIFKKAESTSYYVAISAPPLYKLYQQYVFYA